MEIEGENMEAKSASLLAKVIAGLVVLVGAILKWSNIFPNCSINELCVVGFTLMGLFGTVDLNIALDKFTKKKEGETEECTRG